MPRRPLCRLLSFGASVHVTIQFFSVFSDRGHYLAVLAECNPAHTYPATALHNDCREEFPFLVYHQADPRLLKGGSHREQNVSSMLSNTSFRFSSFSSVTLSNTCRVLLVVGTYTCTFPWESVQKGPSNSLQTLCSCVAVSKCHTSIGRIGLKKGYLLALALTWRSTWNHI